MPVKKLAHRRVVALVAVVALLPLLSACVVPFPRHLLPPASPAPTAEPTRPASSSELPDPVTFDAGAELSPAVEFGLDLSLGSDWITMNVLQSTGSTLSEFVDRGCVLATQAKPYTRDFVADDDLENSVRLVSHYLGLTGHFEASSVMVPVNGTQSAIEALLVVSTAPDGGQVITVARGLGARGQALIISLRCDLGVDATVTYTSEVTPAVAVLAFVR